MVYPTKSSCPGSNSHRDFGVITAIITGAFNLIKSQWSRQSKDSKMHDSTINIMQSTTGNNNTFIGVQNNKDDRK